MHITCDLKGISSEMRTSSQNSNIKSFQIMCAREKKFMKVHKKKKFLYQQKRPLDGHFPNHPSPDRIVPDMDMMLTCFQELLQPKYFPGEIA